MLFSKKISLSLLINAKMYIIGICLAWGMGGMRDNLIGRNRGRLREYKIRGIEGRDKLIKGLVHLSNQVIRL